MSNYERADFWTQKARKEGYPARSVYKLQELNEKFALFSVGKKGAYNLRALDLGAAPGSWSLFVLRSLKETVILTACDLLPMSAEFCGDYFKKDNAAFIQGDFTSEEVKKAILERGQFDLILSDAAPATTGNRLVDTARSTEIAAAAFDYAKLALCRGGSLAVKIFQGSDSAALVQEIRPLFKSVKTAKPAACRSESFEHYIIAKEFLGR